MTEPQAILLGLTLIVALALLAVAAAAVFGVGGFR